MIFRNRPGVSFLILALLYPLVFLLLFKSLQHHRIYRSTLGLISVNYLSKGGWNDHQVLEQKAPYAALTNDNIEYWDAMIYRDIKNDMYRSVKGVPTLRAAFFPLFPLIWKVSRLDARGIMVLNYLMFVSGLFILIRLFTGKEDLVFYQALGLSFPASIIFFIPYSEATFFLTFSVAAVGLVRKKYGIYFFGMFLMAMTRPAALFVGSGIIAADILVCLKNGVQLKDIPGSVIRKIVPFIAGFLFALLIEYVYTGDFFTLFEVEKSWGGHFSLPSAVSDWSVEGFGMSLFSIFFLSIPAVIYLVYEGVMLLKKSPAVTGTQDFVFYLSLFYVAGMFLFLMFHTGGNLAGYSRYTLASPFFFCILLNLKRKISHSGRYPAVVLFMVALLLLAGSLIVINYGGPRLSFKFTGLYLAVAFSALILLRQRFSSGITRYLLPVACGIGIVWQTYLLNMLLNNAWIFT